MPWDDQAPFQPKLERLIAQIDRSEGQVVLVGVSAGATAALIAYSERPTRVHAVVTICGRIRGGSVEHLRPRSPSFVEAVERLKEVEPTLTRAERRRILTLHPLSDGVVSVEAASLPGAENRTIPSVGHLASIVFALLFYPEAITSFIAELPD
jgi:pimeloyl-ACP methyl ester carboxylesterase